MKAPVTALVLVTLITVRVAAAAPPSTIGWIPRVTGSKASLRGLSVPSAAVIWASGSGGTVLRSIDAGEHWTSVTIPGGEALDFRDVEGFDDSTAVVMATAGKIWRTTDGGAHWTRVYDDPRKEIFLDAFAFSGRRGVALGDPIDGRFVLLETSDGGATWREMPNERRPVSIEGESAFAASGSCIDFTDDVIRIVTGGSRARLVWSSDRGKSWKSATLPLVSGNDSSGAFGMAVAGARVAVVGGNYKMPKPEAEGFAVSNDGGATWHQERPMPFRSAAAFAGGHGVLIVTGTSGSNLSFDDGRSWSAMAGGYNAVVCHGRKICVAAGSDGRVARLTPH